MQQRSDNQDNQNQNMYNRMRRRTFLTICAGGALLSACGEGHAATTSTKPTTIASSKPSPTPATLTNDDWTTLAKDLQGTLILPDNQQYDSARQLFDEQYDNVKPAGIAYCTSAQDIQTCLAFVQRFGLPCTARSGGHSYAGYSTTTGLIVDVTRMDSITVDTNSQKATIGSGTRLIDVYASLAQHGMVIPAGSCPTVGIAGLTLGGGIGVLGRKFGLTSDNLLSTDVVLANGKTLTCNAQQNADLFWALRGGGGGNFCVVTSFTFQTHPVSNLTLFTLSWPWSSAANVVDTWQNWAPQAPDEIWSNCLLLATTNKSASPIVQVNGVYVGTASGLNPLLAQLTNNIDATPLLNYVSNAGILDAMQYEAGCSNQSVSACHLPGQTTDGDLQRNIMDAKSDYYTQRLPGTAIAQLVSSVTERQTNARLGEGGIGLDASGGAINRVAPNATAFVHRNALFSIQYTANRNPGDSSTIVQASQDWLQNAWQSMRSYASGEAYQNYIDPHLSNWQEAYYGSNLARLEQVKATYDPTNLFHFAQSIPVTK